MTYKDLDTIIGTIGLPYAYYQFKEDTGQQPPFICWMLGDIDDLYADNINYQRIAPLTIELYTDEKDFAQEIEIENFLTGLGWSYGKEEEYLDTERMHMTIYTMEVVINAE